MTDATEHRVAGGAGSPGIGRVCVDCGAIIAEGDGYVFVQNSHHHQNCVQSAYYRGLRSGYKDAIRQIRDATRALKGPK